MSSPSKRSAYTRAYRLINFFSLTARIHPLPNFNDTDRFPARNSDPQLHLVLQKQMSSSCGTRICRTSSTHARNKHRRVLGQTQVRPGVNPVKVLLPF